MSSLLYQPEVASFSICIEAIASHHYSEEADSFSMQERERHIEKERR